MIANERRHSNKKAGRPKQIIKKESATGVRFTNAEYLIVEEKAKMAGLKITQYIRQVALGGNVVSRLNEEEKQLIRQLIGIANNLNQLTKKAHQKGFFSVVKELEKYYQILDMVLNKLRKE